MIKGENNMLNFVNIRSLSDCLQGHKVCLFSNKFLGKVNEFWFRIRKFLWEKKKVTFFFILYFFDISHKSGIKTFLKWSINKCLKGTHLLEPEFLT